MGFFDIISSLFRKPQENINPDDDIKNDPKLIEIPSSEVLPKQQSKNYIFNVDDLYVYPPEEPSAPSEHQLPTTGVGERKRVAGLWNAYGNSILKEAKDANMEPAIALAIFSVESGRAYDTDTGLAIIRMEPAVFKRYSGKEVFCPHTNQRAEWESLKNAYLTDKEAAMKSFSIGLAQIMTFNHKLIGYDTPLEMFNNLQKSCRAQVASFFSFCKKNGLDEKARNEDFIGFAKRYNGLGQEIAYSNKMKMYLSHARDLLK